MPPLLSEAGLSPYWGILMMFAAAAAVGFGAILLGMIFRPKHETAAKSKAYECGIDPVGDTKERIPVRYQVDYDHQEDERLRQGQHDAPEEPEIIRAIELRRVPQLGGNIVLEESPRDDQIPDADGAGLQDRYPRLTIANFDGQPDLTEMDALIAYLQVLGTMVDFSTFIPDPSR